MKKNIKLQVKAMNVALENYAESCCAQAGLKPYQKNKVINNLKYQEPYTSMEVYKSQQIYKTMNTAGASVKKQIDDILKDGE